jgi:hypothetical protein
MHRIRHWLHWQPIEVVSEWRGPDLWIGARCVVCDEVTGWHRSHVRQSHMPP